MHKETKVMIYSVMVPVIGGAIRLVCVCVCVWCVVCVCVCERERERESEREVTKYGELLNWSGATKLKLPICE